jgi:hypothetical protein
MDQMVPGVAFGSQIAQRQNRDISISPKKVPAKGGH